MSDDPKPDLNLRKLAAEIDQALSDAARSREETRKFVAETRELTAESSKLDRDRLLAPVIAIGGLIVAALALVLRH